MYNRKINFKKQGRNFSMATHKENFFKGMRDGIPICTGYFAVSITLGIAAKNAGLTVWQATLASMLTNASAGEFAAFTLIAANASYWELIVMEIVANARYLLMSCALSQKLSPATGLGHRLGVGFGITDEIFGISVTSPGMLDPFYSYGAMSVALPGWALGTCLGVLLGNILPLRAVSALSVGLYGMFVAIFIPPAKKDKVIAVLVVLSFASSYVFSSVPLFAAIPSGTRTILLTVALSLGAAVLFPIHEEAAEACHEE